MTNFYKKINLIFSIFFCVFFVTGCNSNKEKTAEYFLNQSGFTFYTNTTINTDSFKLIENRSYDSEKLKTYQSDHDEILRILAFPASDKEAAKKIILQRSQLITELYEDKLTEYRGKHVVPEACHQKNQTKVDWHDIKNGFYIMLRLMSDQNYNYGSCLDSSDYYKSQLLLIYCESAKTVLESKLFYNKNNSTLNIPLIDCRN